MVPIQSINTLYGFHTGRCTGNASLEANLIQKLKTIREEVIYDNFLDIHKAYDALDCGRFLVIIAAYDIGPQELRLL